MPGNIHSEIVTQGAQRSPTRAMLRTVGFKDGDFDNAIIGIAKAHTPCNAGRGELAMRAAAALQHRYQGV